jgi:hypothetical protein
VPKYGKASALAIVETHAHSTELGLQNAVLFAQKRNQICLLTMKSPTHRQDNQLKQRHARSLEAIASIQLWDITGSTMRDSPSPESKNPKAPPYDDFTFMVGQSSVQVLRSR